MKINLIFFLVKINSPYSSKQLSVDDQELLSSFVYIYEFLNLMFPKVLKNVLFVSYSKMKNIHLTNFTRFHPEAVYALTILQLRNCFHTVCRMKS